MSSRHHAPGVSWIPTDVRTTDVRASLPTPTHASLRHSPVTAFEWTTLLGSTAWIVALTFLRWPAPLYGQFDSNSTIDSAFFALAGRMVRDGQVPYVAFWDHKPPLIYLINAFALTLSSGAVWGIWLVTVAALVATLGMAWLAWRPTVGPTAAVIGIAWAAFSVGIVAPFNLTEGFMLPVQAATMLVLARWSPLRRGAFVPGLAVGALAGVAFMLRPNLIGTPAAVGATMVTALLLTGRAQQLPALIGGGVVGAALVASPILIWLGMNGALGSFREQVFHYNTVYSAASWLSRARAAFEGVANATAYGTLLLPFIGWLVVAHRFVVRRRSATPKPVLLFALLWAPMEVLLAAVPGRTYMHYFALLLLPLGLLTAIAACEAFVLVARAGPAAVTERWRRAAAAVVCAAIAVVPLGRTLIGIRDSGLRGERAEQVDATARYLREHTPANSRLFVWGHAADVYLFANRAPASRFVYPLALLTPRYASDTLVAGLVEELRASAPPLIVDATPGASKSDALVPSLARWNPTWQYPESGIAWWTMTPALRAFYDHVATNYTIVDSVGPQHWVIYARRSDLDQR